MVKAKVQIDKSLPYFTLLSDKTVKKTAESFTDKGST